MCIRDRTIAIRLTASEPGKLNFEAELRGVRNEAHSNYGTDYFRMDVEGNDELVLRGKSAEYLGIECRLRCEARVKVKTEGGSMTVKGTRIKIQDANAVTLYFVAATNFVNYKDVSGDEKQKVKTALDPLDRKEYEGIKKAAGQDYQQFFNRVKLTMPGTESSYLPTDERLKKIETAPDPQLAALIYQFGRYLLISSSRVGTQPANLQGIWNKDMNPSWDSKYTTNINPVSYTHLDVYKRQPQYSTFTCEPQAHVLRPPHSKPRRPVLRHPRPHPINRYLSCLVVL